MKQAIKFLIFTYLISLSNNLICQTIGAGGRHSHAICGTGLPAKYNSAVTTPGISVLSWGHNNYGQLGDGTNGTPACVCGSANCCKNIPVTLPSSANFISLSAGGDHTLMLRNDFTVWAYGVNLYGNLGIGNIIDSNIPVQVSITNVKAISAGSAPFSLFLKNDGTVWACGYNFDGELGDASNTDKTTPVQVSGLTGITAIAAGEKHSLFLKNDGTVWACGYNAYGQLGIGNTINKNIPVQIPSLSSIVAIGAGDMHSIFVKSDGSVLTCGRNQYGQAADGTSVLNKLTPTATLPILSGIVAADGGFGYSVFLKNDGTVWASGYNADGQLGNGTISFNNSTPTQMLVLSNINQISAGQYHGLFLNNNGTLWTTGSNYNGELGLGSYVDQNVPSVITNICPINIVSIKEKSNNEMNFNVYPSPKTGIYVIESKVNSDLVEIFDVAGKKVFEKGNVNFPTEIDLSNCNQGVYLIKLKSNQTYGYKKFIKVD
ncbi:T9SS type A sorting domain-containing protein [Flavobacterium filum]|uniref:T9SS type A sorting domain-containing protein n=1 Tax=Flavobacterium filum TaxID=370974 RepID=UPI0023F00E74|nr:T9SS type A sorting domain-containing protein [Flavobacterium filum]